MGVMIKLKPLIVSLLISLGVGGLSALLTKGSMEKYRSLNQPPLSPPGWVFPVVWTVLFAMMGIAAYLVWMQDGPGRDGAGRWHCMVLSCSSTFSGH